MRNGPRAALHSNEDTAQSTLPQQNYQAGELLVVLNTGEGCEEMQQVCTDYGLALVGALPDGRTYRLMVPAGTTPVSQETELSNDQRISSVSPNYFAENAESRQSSMAFDEGFLDTNQFVHQTSLKRLGIGRAQLIATGRGVLVAVLDTGADPTHPALDGRIDPASYDFVEGDADPSDLPDFLDNDADGLIDEGTGHGSHVAGLVSLVAPESRLLVLRVLDSDGRGTAYNVARAIEYAADHGATVINASLGMLEESSAVKQALEYGAARGVVFVGPAGNWGAEEPEEYPASDELVWAVAACDSTDRAAAFTSYGDDVVISAPGTRIRSTYWNGGYAIWSGTSMSAPFIAGTAALLRQLHPDWTKDQLLHRIQTTADPVIPLNSEQIGHLGAGRLNVGSALAPDAIIVFSGGDLTGEEPQTSSTTLVSPPQ